jgi:hypothetical protein
MQMRRFRLLMVTIAIGLGFAFGLSGCSDDLYTSCRPGDNLDCGDSEGCVSEPNFQCDTRVCGKFQGSKPFCTRECQSDGDCPDGKCRQFVLGRKTTFCVPSNQLNN